ncbi:MAG: hypothetical protein HGA22_13955, partial [Clostridiales bacterium]|nr:hypothetical protein [Clostridiales bacterium]
MRHLGLYKCEMESLLGKLEPEVRTVIEGSGRFRCRRRPWCIGTQNAFALLQLEIKLVSAGFSAHYTGNHRYVFTLIHKFQTPELLCDRSDVIVLTDEAHRSQ